MAKSTWISDKDLFTHVTNLINKAKSAKNEASKKFGKNVIDPFSSLFELSGFELNYSEWKKNETARQAQKTLQNHVGEFHQEILGCCKGWKNLKTGKVMDLISSKVKVLAEIKNKFNTISGGKLSDLYYSLERQVMPQNSIYKGYIAYYVAIIPKTPKKFNREFTPPDKEKKIKCPANKMIREIDGASFYALVTGKRDALKELFLVLPEVIFEITGKQIDNKNLENFFDKAYGV